ncbi:MAG TPA: cell wall-binding repeat-containing protein [Nocardioidaceae bacterium]|nr:cell wall-binding repeat-containing protein [Nocardioidaceae bacterium]
MTWEPGFDASDLSIKVSAHVDGTWTAWENLDVHADNDPSSTSTQQRAGSIPTWTGEADGIGVRVFSADGDAPEDLQVALIDGGTGLAEPVEATAATDGATAGPSEGATDGATDGTAVTTTATTTGTTTTGTDVITPVAATGVAPMPRIVTRAEWGVDRSSEVSCDKPNTVSTMKGVVIHHTAGANDYTAAEAPGIVRGIHRYHTAVRGWCDTGYNFLVDKYGVIYEGRRGGIMNQVRGAHAGNWDVNTYTTGISMMGNFDEAPLTKRLKSAVTRLAAWRLSLFGRRAIGKVNFDGHRLPKVSGHRDVYRVGIRPATATACPGKYAYDWLNHTGLRKRIQARIDAAGGGTTTEPTPTEPTPEPPEPTTRRMAGGDRYATSAAMSREAFPKASAVFLASGESFPDALSGGPAAAKRKAPTLLTKPDSLPTATATELDRLNPSAIFVLGGTAAISDEVARAAAAYGPVTRLNGSNRYATGAVVTSHFWSSADRVYLASGMGYPDALSGGAAAAHDGAPILLSPPDHLPEVVRDELVALGPDRVILLGGTASLSRDVAVSVRQALPEGSVRRLFGQDRFATSAKIARVGWDETGGAAYFASGDNFPDALSGVSAAGKNGAPLLLTRPGCTPSPVFDQLQRLDPLNKVLLGGAAVLTEEALETECAAS